MELSQRRDNRALDSLRAVSFIPNFTVHAEGSVLIRQGDTHVLCNVSVEPGTPAWMTANNMAGGWVTAEYAMLPRATHQRSRRELNQPISRNREIQRLVGRSLRAAVKLDLLPPITCIVDCDVLQADGGTRTAAITGGYVALIMALHRALEAPLNLEQVCAPAVAAISVGRLNEQIWLDLDYQEDSNADADLNVVMNTELALIEVQGTAERGSLARKEFDLMLDVAQHGIEQLLAMQSACLREHGIEVPFGG